MTSVQQTPKPGCLRNAPALVEEMKLLGEFHVQSGVRKVIDSELWHACAGPLVSLPQVGSLAYYYPQGHSEQVAVSTGRPASTHIPNYSNLPSQLLCQIHNVTLHADRDTDEIYAQMTLQPLNPEKEIFSVPDFGIKPSKHPSEFFCKTLTASDTSTHGGFSVPRRAAEKLFPPLDYSMQPPNQELEVRDLHDNSWTFRHIYRGQPRRHLLTTGWSLFVGAKRLRAGDSVLFIRDERSQLLLGVRRANRQQTILPSSVLSADSMHMGILAAAAHAAANRSPFTVFYNPRACPAEFVIPLDKHHKAVYGTHVSIGMRFGMMFETEESGKRRHMGTIIRVIDLDPIKWPNSKWRNLQVEWDEPGCDDRPSRVSLWEIETPESPFVCPAPHASLKRSFHSGFAGAECEWENTLKRPLSQFLEREKGDVQHPLFPNLGSELMKMIINTQSISPDAQLMEASIMQYLRSNELTRCFPSATQACLLDATVLQQEVMGANGHALQKSSLSHVQQRLISPQNILPQNPSAKMCHNPPEFTDSDLLLQGETRIQEQVKEEPLPEQNDKAWQDEHNERPDIGPATVTGHLGDHSQRIMSALLHMGPICQDAPLGKCGEDKFMGSLLNPQNLVNQMYQNQASQQLSTLHMEANNNSSFLYPNHHSPPYFDTADWVLHPSSCQTLCSVIKSPISLTASSKAENLLLSPLANASTVSNVSSGVSIETSNPIEKLQFSCTSTLANLQDALGPQQLEYLKFPSGCRPLSDESNNQSEAYSSLQFDDNPSVSQRGLEGLPTVRDIGFENPYKFLGGNFSSNQDVQSQVTSASLGDSQAFSFQDFPDNTGGTSSNVEVDDNSFLQQGSWQQVPPPLRTYTKVQKLGSVGRSIDVTRFQNYDELNSAIACMFGLEGQLDDPRGSKWKLVYVDYENDVLLVGDDPWEEFVSCVRCIRILSSTEVQQMSQEGMEILNNPIVQGGTDFIA